MQRIARLSLAAAPVVLAATLFAPMTLNAGEPASATTTAATAPAAQPARMAPMTQAQLLEHLRSHPDHVFVLDVRTPQEFAEGHVPGAVNVPYDQVASRLAEVPKDKDIVLYCRSGRRAGLAADVLAAQGYTRLSHLEGDMPAWIEKGHPVEK
jgi:rhodanese-related sulfurtransferase